MISDANKGLTSIEYNYLNLPTKVVVAGNGNNGTIDYIYDATGIKLQKTVTDGSSVTTDYAGNFVYEGGNLQFLNHAEGYIEPDGSGGYDYIYQCKDHLGNIRLSFADDNGDGSVATSEIREENNYYPFGLKHMGYKGVVNGRNHKYGYGGKEEQDELDLAWLDITARNYDPALGRWMNLDPLAEMMRRHSPYNYAFDNPIYFTDPDGMAPEGSNEGGQSNDSSTQFRVEDEHGNVVTMNSEQLAEYITANGVTEDFTFDDGTGGGKGSGDRARKRNKDKNKDKTKGKEDKAEENCCGFTDISNEEEFPGIKIYETENIADNSAVTLPGIGIFIHSDIKGVDRLMVLQHEYGHYLDYLAGMGASGVYHGRGVTFYIGIGLPSLLNTIPLVNKIPGLDGDHRDYWTETRANKWAKIFFEENLAPNFEIYFPTKDKE
jgi:RHS repeat-associated protein